MEQKLHDALIEFGQEIGPRAHITASLDNDKDIERRCSVGVWPDGLTGKRECFWSRAVTFAAALEGAKQRWSEMRDEFEDRAIRDMALAIIRITDQFGACPDAALRADKFTDDDIKRHGDAACERAERMAANGPFSIARIGLSNAPRAAE